MKQPAPVDSPATSGEGRKAYSRFGQAADSPMAIRGVDFLSKMAIGTRPNSPIRNLDESVSQPIRVLIVDDEKLFAELLTWSVEGHGMVTIGIAGTGQDAIEMAAREQPDLVLLDVNLPDMEGLEAGRAIMAKAPGAKMIAVSSRNNSGSIQMREAIASGFHGYLTKDMPIDDFANSIRAALHGHIVIPLSLAREALGRRTANRVDHPILVDRLTARERHVLELLVEGASSQQIAARLSISRNTVRTHVQSISAKLQVHSRLEAAAVAVRLGLVQVDR